MVHEGDDERAGGPQGDARPELRVIPGGRDDARCVSCGVVTGPDARWWYDGTNELVPFCPDCSVAEFGD